MTFKIDHVYKGDIETVLTTTTIDTVKDAALRYLGLYEQRPESYHYVMVNKKKLSLFEFLNTK